MSDREAVVEAFGDAIRWFHDQLDRQIDDHTPDGNHPNRATTAREWFTENRGFEPETLDAKLFGYAPLDSRDDLLVHLNRRGHDREAILATGLFTDDLRPLWHGRYVFPYFDRDGRPVYAISRATGGQGGGKAGYGGHPADFIHGKYGKLAHTKDYAEFEEPIYGLGTLDRDGPVLITEGVVDAIRAHEYGYACISPVTTQFKNEHLQPVANALGDGERRVYVVQDNEPAPVEHTKEVDGWEQLAVKQVGPGTKGGLRTVRYLREADHDAYLAELPRMNESKVDLDGYLRDCADTLSPVLAGAKPAVDHPAYEQALGADTQATRAGGAAPTDTAGSDDWDGGSDAGEATTFSVKPGYLINKHETTPGRAEVTLFGEYSQRLCVG